MASRDNHLLKSYIQSRESLNICVIMTNNKGKQYSNIPITDYVKCMLYSPRKYMSPSVVFFRVPKVYSSVKNSDENNRIRFSQE